MVVFFRTNGVAAKALAWMDNHHLFVILPIIGILSSIGVFIWSGHRTMPAPEPISRSAQKGDYCYMDVQYLTNWVLKVSNDTGNEIYYYLATDTNNDHYIVTMFESQFRQFMDIVAFTENPNTAPTPSSRRMDGILKSMPVEEAESLAEGLDLTAEEYHLIFGKCFVDLTEDPDTIIVGRFIWVLGISILILLLRGIAAVDEFTERRKQKSRGSIL